MPRITIEITVAESLALKDLVTQLNTPAPKCELEKLTSHGPLTIKKLLTMLAEDAAMVSSRPGSWEGANMATILQSHGYHI